MIQRFTELMNQWFNGSMNQRISESLDRWINSSKIPWINESIFPVNHRINAFSDQKSPKSAPIHTFFGVFYSYKTEFSLHSRAHFANLILQKVPRSPFFVSQFLCETELSLHSRAHLDGKRCRLRNFIIVFGGISWPWLVELLFLCTVHCGIFFHRKKTHAKLDCINTYDSVYVIYFYIHIFSYIYIYLCMSIYTYIDTQLYVIFCILASWVIQYNSGSALNVWFCSPPLWFSLLGMEALWTPHEPCYIANYIFHWILWKYPMLYSNCIFSNVCFSHVPIFTCLISLAHDTW